MSVKGLSWMPEDIARLDALRRREWLASFFDRDVAVVFAWANPGAFVVAEGDRVSVYRWRP